MPAPATSTPPAILGALMFQSFACTMGMMAFTALAGPIGRSLGLAPWQMGTAVTVAGLAWVLTARRWGQASDRLGRRPVLLLGLAGFAASYAALCLFTAWALDTSLPALAAFAGLVVWRGLSGTFYAAIPAASAALVADHTEPANRAGAMARLGMAGGASMVIGPALAGMLAPVSLTLPLYLIAALPVAALAVLWRRLPAGAPLQSQDGQPPRFSDPRLRQPVVVAFVSMFCVAQAQIVVGFYAIDRLGLSPQAAGSAAGAALTCVGVALTLAQMAVSRLGRPPRTLIRLGAAVAAAGFALAPAAADTPQLAACYFVAAAGMGLVWPSISALAANAVEPHEQGAAAGTVTAAQGLGTILGPLVGTMVYGVDTAAPYALSALLLVALIPWGLRGIRKKNA